MSRSTSSRLSEDELIAKVFAPLAGLSSLGLRDDAALLSVPEGHQLVLTKDMLIENVHFFASDPPGAIAQKALRVNLSDLAAKAAEPLGFLLGLALPANWTEAWCRGFAQGLKEDGETYRFPLLGGDTVKTPGPLSLSITALGSVLNGKMVPRPGVESGDQLYVSGTIGDAALGLRLRLNREEDGDWIGRLSQPAHKFLQDRYLLPLPRLALRAPLQGFARTAMDISDGLIGDLTKMLRLTGMTTTLIAADMPISFAVREALSLEPRLIESVLTGGDDYELLCAVSPEKIASFEASLETSGLSMRCIGRAKKGKGSVSVLDAAGKPLMFTQNSFQHF